MAKPSNAVSNLSYDGKTSYEIVPHSLTDGTYVASAPTMSADSTVVIDSDFHTISIQAEGNSVGSFLAKSANDAVINIKASDLGLSSAMKFLGTTTTAISEGSTTASITLSDKTTVTAVAGNVVLYGHKEFLFSGSKWEELGDESSYALKSITITGTGALIGGGTLEANRQISHVAGDAANKSTGFYKFSTDGYSHIKSVTSVVASDIKNLGFVDTSSDQTVGGKKTFSAPSNVSGTEQATSVFKTANGGQIIFGKEAGNSGTMIGLDQVAGTRRLNFRASATAGAIVWSQPESNSQLYYDVAIVYFRQCTKVTFDSASTITLSKFKSAGYLYTDSSGNLKSGSLASVATSGKYSDLTGTPTLASVATSGSYNDLTDTPTIPTVNNGGIAIRVNGSQVGSFTLNQSTSYQTIDVSDTKNTAGSTEYGVTGSPLYLIGASSQAANPQSYSNKYCYIQYGSLYSYGHKVAETYAKDNEHYIATEAGYYKISAASSKNSDGTYNDVTILTTENIAEKGLFVPMTGTINTPMTGGIHQQIAYDIQTSSGGLTPAGGGSTTTSTRYSEAFYGEKGFEYVFYRKDSNYGTDDSTAVGSNGITYKPFDGVTNTGYYTTVDTILNEGLNIWRLDTQGYGTNTGSTTYYDYLQFVSILPNATLKYKTSGSSSTTTVDLKNLQTKLVSGTSIKTINSQSLLGSGNLTGTDIVPKASNTDNYSSVPNYGLMGMYCYYYTGGAKGYANIVNGTKGVFIRFGIFTASSNGTAKTISFDKPMSMCIGTSTVVQNAHSVSVMLVDGSGMSSNATYRNSNAVTAVSYSGFTYVNGNSETGTIRYLAIGVFGA